MERFLEGAPLLLGYLDVAYGKRAYSGKKPERDMLQAFRVSPRLQHALNGAIAAPRVTVQPNFEVFVECEVYPAAVLAQIAPLGQVLSEGLTTIVRLDKTSAAAHLVKNPGLDLAALLSQLSGRELPQNAEPDHLLLQPLRGPGAGGPPDPEGGVQGGHRGY